MSDNTSSWEFADKPDYDLLLDDTIDFEPASEPKEPVYAVVCDADACPSAQTPQKPMSSRLLPTGAWTTRTSTLPNESIGYVSLNNLRFEPPLPPAAGNMEYYDSGDYEDLWDLQVGYQDDDNSYEVWNDDPA